MIIYVYAYEDKEKGGWYCWLETCAHTIRGVFDKMIVIWGRDKLKRYEPKSKYQTGESVE